MGLLDGKIALVSGVGPGMGRDISLQLAEHGADVVLGARTEANVDKVADEVEALGRKALRTQLDITDETSCQGAVDAATSALGRIDILVNNAFQDGDHRLFEKASLDSWRTTMDVNLWGTLQLTQAVVPVMKKQRDGRIVMVNSMSAVRTEPRFGAYAASKSALGDGHEDARTRARPVRHPGERHPPRLHLERQSRVVHQLHGREGRHHLRGEEGAPRG